MRIRDNIFRIRHSNTQNHSNLLISYFIKRKIFNIHRNQEDNGFGGRLPKTKYCITIFFLVVHLFAKEIRIQWLTDNVC